MLENINSVSNRVQEEALKNPMKVKECNFDIFDSHKVLDILKNRKQYDVEVISYQIERNIPLIFSKENIGLLFMSNKVLTALESVIRSISLKNKTSTENAIGYTYKLNWCEYAYSYLTSNDSRKSISEKIIEITALLYSSSVNKLMSLVKLSKKFSVLLVICRHSSSVDDWENTVNINFAMMTSKGDDKIKIKDQQAIIYIYETLYDNITTLFTCTYFDFQSGERYTEDAMEVYSYQSLAVLEILNNMTLDQIYSVLANASQEYMKDTNRKTRFNIMNLSSDYYRIKSVAMSMENSGYTFPR